MNIPALEANVEELERRIKRLQSEIEATKLELQLTRNDIAAARLREWYAANPGIELAVGDHLAVTEEFMETNSLGAVWWEGEGYPIEEVFFFGDEDVPSVLICETNGGNPEHVPMPLARRMRQAWLQEHAE